MNALLFSLFMCAAMLLPETPSPYTLGDKVEEFSLVNAVNNKRVSLSDYATQKGVVIIFSSHSCPYSKLYEDRIIQLANDFEQHNIKFILINPNCAIRGSAEESKEAMAKRAAEKNYSFPYLIDDNATNLQARFEASRTPECFVLKNIDGHFIIHYHGAIDDNPQIASDVSYNYLKEALTCLAHDKALRVNEKKAIGCMIKRY